MFEFMFNSLRRPARHGARAASCAFALLVACQGSDDPEPATDAGAGGMAGHPHVNEPEGGASGSAGSGMASSGMAAGGTSGGDPAGGAMDGGAAGEDDVGAAGEGGIPPTTPVLNGCTVYVDRTEDSASRTLAWTDELAYAPERCLKIRVDQRVTFSGDFVEHPLAPLRGDTPNPVTAPSAVFPDTGVFGYVCTTHPPMIGAIWVVP